ncbi:MAG: TetR/AcrR family transcriptional regulator [Moraxellaceae bacterium]|nr:TetR/AcrR family transcriptional regulator [Moraxellaceae bacterium]MDZ4387670.1 TetR/AcrR family transcriptional regulator [Moraxellaceae bacterium]
MTGRQRKPMQQRTQERVEKALQAAQQLLLSHGPEEVSIPDVAELSGVPRASLYQFFPSKYHLFAAIAEHSMQDCIGALRVGSQAMAGMCWQEATPIMVQAAQEFFNANPVASILVLGWPMSRETYLSQETNVVNLADSLREVFDTFQPSVQIPIDPDAAVIGTEIVFALFKHSYFMSGRVTNAICQQATIALNGYLQAVLVPAATE